MTLLFSYKICNLTNLCCEMYSIGSKKFDLIPLFGPGLYIYYRYSQLFYILFCIPMSITICTIQTWTNMFQLRLQWWSQHWKNPINCNIPHFNAIICHCTVTGNTMAGMCTTESYIVIIIDWVVVGRRMVFHEEWWRFEITPSNFQ